MKVLLIDVNCKNSSTGRIVYDLYSYINANGNEAAVCYGRGEKILEKNIYKFGLDWETDLHAFLTRVTGYTGCFSFFSTRRLIRYIQRFKPDVIHIHELHAYFVNLKPLLSYLKKTDIKIIMTLHCEFAYTGKCGYSHECAQWKTKCGKCPHLHDYPKVFWFDRTEKMFNDKKSLLTGFRHLTVVTPSSWLHRRVKESFLKDYDACVIHNGIDTACFRIKDANELRKKLGISDDEKVVLSLAPNLMSRIKGGSFVSQLADRLKDEKIRFVFVGVDGVTEKRVGNKIMFGRIYDKELLSEFYSLADLFVICSERENFPTSCIEAQCCGASVVGFDAGGTKETILFKPDQSCVGYGDVESLKTLILNRLSEKPDREYISQIAIAEYNNDNMAQKYFQLYTDKNG